MPNLEINVIALGEIESETSEAGDGWGDGKQANVKGDVSMIEIHREGELKIGLHISASGRLTITDYSGMHFNIAAGNNLTLYPERRWQD